MMNAYRLMVLDNPIKKTRIYASSSCYSYFFLCDSFMTQGTRENSILSLSLSHTRKEFCLHSLRLSAIYLEVRAGADNFTA